MVVLKSMPFMMGGKSENNGHPVRFLVYDGNKVLRAKELEETLVTDGPSREPGLLLDSLNGYHWVPTLGELGCKFVELRGSIHIEVLGGQEVEEGALV